VQDFRGDLGRRIRELRERLDISQEQLAERAGLHWTYISGIERGVRDPGLNVLAKLSRALKVSMADLVVDLRPNVRHKARKGRPAKRERR
jgi:transcriptional regulator with XRE-family HTH domain